MAVESLTATAATPSLFTHLNRLLVTEELDARNSQLALRARLGDLEAEEPPHRAFFFFLKRWFVSFVRSSIGRCE